MTSDTMEAASTAPPTESAASASALATASATRALAAATSAVLTAASVGMGMRIPHSRVVVYRTPPDCVSSRRCCICSPVKQDGEWEPSGRGMTRSCADRPLCALSSWSHIHAMNWAASCCSLVQNSGCPRPTISFHMRGVMKPHRVPAPTGILPAPTSSAVLAAADLSAPASARTVRCNIGVG